MWLITVKPSYGLSLRIILRAVHAWYNLLEDQILFKVIPWEVDQVKNTHI